MSVTTNARGAEQLQAANRYIQAHSHLLPDFEADIQFDADGNVILTEDGDEMEPMPFDSFVAWLDNGAPRNDDEGDEIEEEWEEEEEESIDEALDSIADAPDVVVEDEPEEELQASMDDVIAAAYVIHEEEHSGELGRNKARYKRGHFLLAVEDSLDQLGVENRKELLDRLNSGMLVMANAHNATDRYKPISETEASMTMKVAQTFASGGVDDSFELVDAIDPTTGQPIQNDAGMPPELPITEVALSKLYPLVEYASEENRDKLVSFAHRYTEGVVKKLKRHAKDTDTPMIEMIDRVNNMRVRWESPVLGEEIAVQPDETEVLNWLREQRGEEAPSEVYTIKTTRDWAEAVWVPLKAFASHVYATFGLPLADDGQISNVKLLESTIGAFHPAEDGFYAILARFIDAGDITEEQAKRYLDRIEDIDVETGVVRLSDASDIAEAEEEAERLDEDDLDDGEGLFDEDIDIDVATVDVDDNDEEEEDNEFDIEDFDEEF